MSYRNIGFLLFPLNTGNGIGVRHHTDSDALYAVGGGNTGLASSVTTNFIPYYLDKKYRREDTPVLSRCYVLGYLVLISSTHTTVKSPPSGLSFILLIHGPLFRGVVYYFNYLYKYYL